MLHGSLFSGIGGFDLAAQWMGWSNVFHCEKNRFCREVLSYYWPEAASYEDIKKTDFLPWRGHVDILTGGFPCQPYSINGARKGKEDERHLWPEMLRAIRDIQPRYVVGENVPGIINWNGGLVFEEVQAEMEAEGYKGIPFILPATGINAPHIRERVWFIFARLDRTVRARQRAFDNRPQEQVASNTARGGFKQRLASGIPKRMEFPPGCAYKRWADWPSQPAVCPGHDGLPLKLDGITLRKWNRETIQASGNAIVPQIAFRIFQAIQQFDHLRLMA